MYIVNFEDTALVGMAMNALEAFFLPMGNSMRGRKPLKADMGHEIFAHLFGVIEEDNIDVTYTIKECNFALTAKTAPGSTYVVEDIFWVKEALREVIAPDLQYVGTCHTHPYRAVDIDECPPRNFLHSACEPTEEDEESDPLEIPFMLDAVFTISNRDENRKIRVKHVSKAMPNVIEWSIGKLYFLLSVNVRAENGGFVPRDEVKLELPRSMPVRLRSKKNSPKNPVLCYKDFTQRLNTKGKFGLCRILTHCSPKR